MNTLLRFLFRTVVALIGFILMPHEVNAQQYEADFIIGNYIRAERTDADGTRWTVKIPNGTKLSVDGRVVRGDSTDCRSVLAEFVYDGKQYTTQARWLRFSDENADGVTDLFAGDDFSPSDRFVTKRRSADLFGADVGQRCAVVVSLRISGHRGRHCRVHTSGAIPRV